MTTSIRAWLTSSTDDHFLRVQQARVFQDDILVTYATEEKRLMSIEGNKSNFNSRQIHGVDLSRLEVIYGESSNIVLQLKRGGVLPLLPDDWETLKRQLSELRAYIDDLENAQRKNPPLQGEGAIAFDLVRASVEMFKPTDFQKIRDELKQIRREVALGGTLHNSASADPIREFFAQLEQMPNFVRVSEDHPNFVIAKHVLHGSGNLPQPAKSGEPTIDDAPPRREPIIIDREKDVFPNFTRDDTFYERQGQSREWNDYGVRLVDSVSRRDLYIFLSHQQGIGSVDSAGSDLIYASKENRSFLLVQYKLLGDKNRFSLDKDEREGQLKELLNLCALQGCVHRIEENSGEYKFLPSSHIRSGSCPVFYKLVGKNHKILADSNFMEGRYVPACMIRSLIDERIQGNDQRKYTLYEEDGLYRGLDYSDFTSMVGKSNMGSKASEYDRLLTEVSGKLNSKVMMLALVDIHQSTKVMA